MSDEVINGVIEEWADYYSLTLTKEQIEDLSHSIGMMNEYESNQYRGYSDEPKKKSRPNLLIYRCTKCNWIGKSDYASSGDTIFCPECCSNAFLSKVIDPDQDILSQF